MENGRHNRRKFNCIKNNTIQKEIEKEKQFELCIAVDNNKTRS